jgi:transcriptional regulator with XRE-family HTH domain
MSLAPYQDPNRFLADRRQQLGLTLEEFAVKAGYPNTGQVGSMISLIEKDRARVPLGATLRLSVHSRRPFPASRSSPAIRRWWRAHSTSSSLSTRPP